ncbi:MAG: phosphotransferase family protein [Bryobacteraceae bacterium]|nr:phosphotransferase family protein [Bryobacteraceae bacterium]
MKALEEKDTAPVRGGEELDVPALASFLSDKLEGAGGAIEVEQFPGGHSNLTYMVRVGGSEYVLRRAPLGPLPPKAHDMAREFRVLDAVHPFFPPAPKPYLLCEDPSVLGAVFYLMERRRGVVLRASIPEPWASLPDLPRMVSRAFLDCLVQLHSVDIVAHGLLPLGKPQGFVERQVRGWSERWYHAMTEEVPAASRVITYLQNNLPPDGPPTLVHNDYKLDNLMLANEDPGRVEAVLDWEMTTVGDPLVDLGLALCYWDPPDKHVRAGPVPCLTTGPGWMTRQQLIEQYTRRMGRDMTFLPFHEVLGIFKLAVIVQQIYQRWFRGQTGDERFATFNVRVKSLMEGAARRVEEMA